VLTLFASLSYVGTLIAPLFGVVGDRSVTAICSP